MNWLMEWFLSLDRVAAVTKICYMQVATTASNSALFLLHRTNVIIWMDPWVDDTCHMCVHVPREVLCIAEISLYAYVDSMP